MSLNTSMPSHHKVCIGHVVMGIRIKMAYLIDKDETAGRRVSKFADVLNSIWQSKNYYEERAFKVCQ